MLHRSLPILAERQATPRSSQLRRSLYDVVAFCSAPAVEASRFHEVLELQRAGTGRPVRLGVAGMERDTICESLWHMHSDVLVIVDTDDVLTESSRRW